MVGTFSLSDSEQQVMLNRFLQYVRTYSESNSSQADSGLQPSSECQRDMAELLKKELTDLGLKDVVTTEKCYTYARLEASPGYENAPSFCLLSHIDTVDEVSGKDVKPLLHEHYDGRILHAGKEISLDPEKDSQLRECAGKDDTIITSSGDTLLGADDKAGVTEIMTALTYLTSHPEVSHGPIEVIFSPDEETGHGMDNVPLNLLKSKMAYTVDGGCLGELETECFNAYKSDITFTGHSVHTGSARGILVNAAVMASYFVSMLPRHQAPETTDGYQGFYAVMEISGGIEKAKVSLLLRDFTLKGMEEKKVFVDKAAETTALSFGGKARVSHTMQYLNMKKQMDENPLVVEKLSSAYRQSGIEPVFIPIRGGTDGSRLTEMGIPTPNIFTGGHNFHSRTEWASFNQMKKAVEVLLNLAVEWTKR